MINFRYHVVSLVAVFLALAVGIALGATILGDRLSQGIVTQAAQDRKTVQDLRAQLDQRRVIENYDNDYAKLVAPGLIAGTLNGQQVALVAMPDAPGSVVDSVTTAVKAAGGQVSTVVAVHGEVFDPTKAADVLTAVKPFTGATGVQAADPVVAQFGAVLARGVLAHTTTSRDATGTNVVYALKGAKLISTSSDTDLRAQLLVIVPAPTIDPRPPSNLLSAHVDFAAALAKGAAGAVVAGPNSDGFDGTDVATIRASSAASGMMSTVDVADLPSGVSTVVLALRDANGGKHGHYGASTSFRDAVAPGLR